MAKIVMEFKRGKGIRNMKMKKKDSSPKMKRAFFGSGTLAIIFGIGSWAMNSPKLRRNTLKLMIKSLDNTQKIIEKSMKAEMIRNNPDLREQGQQLIREIDQWRSGIENSLETSSHSTTARTSL